MTQNQHWYALHTKPYKEAFVTQQLTQKAISTYYPTLDNGRKIRPFFPGYLFIQADLEVVGCNTFNYLRGSRGLVQFGGCAAVVEAAVIARIKASVTTYQARLEGEIVPGTAVRVTDGPLAGQQGIFGRYLSGQERVQILLTFLGTTRAVTLPTGSLSALA